MIFYPYSSPIIITENIFQSYGGEMALSTPALRQIGYWLAEEAVSRDLDSFLLPTIVTGLYHYAPYIMLDHAYIQQVFLVRFKDSKNATYWTASGSYNDYTRLFSDTYGIVDLDYIRTTCGGCLGSYPYSVEISYEAGLPTGTANQPKVLTALTQAATLFINEIQGWGNEAVGNIGITEFRNQQYAEVRTKLIDTVYGNSAKAQFIHKMMDGYRKRRHVGI